VRSPKFRFGWLDALILAVVFGLIGYVLHRAHSHFHYNWDWRLIPGYFVRFDADRGGWVLNLLGQGFLTTVRLALWGSLLAALTSDAAPDVRLAAARRLADRGDRRAIPVLRTAAEGTGPDAVMAAALLGRLAPEESRPDGAALLQKLLREGDTAKRIEVVSLLGNLPIEQARPLLLQALRDRDPLVRRMVVEATSELADADANEASTLLPLAKRLVADRDATVHRRSGGRRRRSRLAGEHAQGPQPRGDASDTDHVERLPSITSRTRCASALGVNGLGSSSIPGSSTPWWTIASSE
jgi:hypothetical protein